MFEGLELLETAVMILDERLRIVYVNPALENLLDLSGKAALGQTLGNLFSGTRSLEDKLQKCLREERGYSDEAMPPAPWSPKPRIRSLSVTTIRRTSVRRLLRSSSGKQ